MNGGTLNTQLRSEQTLTKLVIFSHLNIPHVWWFWFNIIFWWFQLILWHQIAWCHCIFLWSFPEHLPVMSIFWKMRLPALTDLLSVPTNQGKDKWILWLIYSQFQIYFCLKLKYSLREIINKMSYNLIHTMKIWVWQDYYIFLDVGVSFFSQGGANFKMSTRGDTCVKWH